MPEDLQADARQAPPAELMRGPIPNVQYDGRAGEAAAFYARAFGAEDLGRMPWEEKPGQFMHVQLAINGGSLMLTDCRAPWQTGELAPRGYNLTLVVDDGEAWFRRATEAGCEVVMPFQKMFWGDMWGLLRDPFGVEWGIDSPT